MFGGNIMVSPIVTPSVAFNISSTTIWIPEGLLFPTWLLICTHCP